jgi:hypothetical protein
LRAAAVQRVYFPCRVRLNGANAFVLWYEDDRDGFVRSPAGRLFVAESCEVLAARAAALGVSVEPEAGAEYDFDRIREWCRRPTVAGIDCPAFLAAWNFFDDLAGLHTAPSTEYALLSRSASECYDKLFWGTNLPSVTPPGERFHPAWSSEELAAIGRVFAVGVELLEAEFAGDEPDVEPGATPHAGPNGLSEV